MKQGTGTGLKNVLAGTQELAATDGNELLIGEKSGRFFMDLVQEPVRAGGKRTPTAIWLSRKGVEDFVSKAS